MLAERLMPFESATQKLADSFKAQQTAMETLQQGNVSLLQRMQALDEAHRRLHTDADEHSAALQKMEARMDDTIRRMQTSADEVNAAMKTLESLQRTAGGEASHHRLVEAKSLFPAALGNDYKETWSVTWGQCDQSVGGQNCGGSRDRRRRCKCTCAKEACLKKCAHGDLVCKGKCAEKEFPDPSKCRPFDNTVKNRTFTDTDKTLCSPCFMGRTLNQLY